MTISAAHILNLPYPSKCNRLHGHNYEFEVLVYGRPNKNGMIVDYAEMGAAMRDVLNHWDHKLFMPKKDLIGDGAEYARFVVGHTHITLLKDDVILLDGEQSTAEAIAFQFYDEFLEKFDLSSEGSVSVNVKETEGTEASFP